MYFLSLLLTAFCGLGPGLLAAAMSTVVGNFFFLMPVGEFSLQGTSGYLTALFAVMSTLSVVVLGSVQRYALVQRRLLNQEQKIAQQNEALAQTLQKAVSARDDFLAVAGHELKTPVTALSLQAQSWQRRLGKADATLTPERAVEAWQRQAQGLERLSELIDELLNVSGVNRGSLTLNTEPLDLRELTRDVVARYSDVAVERHCNVSVEAPQPVHGVYDRMRIEQVLANLLTNALKYGAGRPVRVVLKQEAKHAVVTVRDEGRGIADADQLRIFECFERATPDPSTSGLGLGLWIVRQIVDACGGSIGVDSTLGRGSAFTVRVPLEPGTRRPKGRPTVWRQSADN
jgi:signal transduction histidine kinase